MQSKYEGVIARTLSADERRIGKDATGSPLVIEADGQRDADFLHSFIARHSQAILADIARHGAVLFRGFEVADEREFERQVLAIEGMTGIHEAMMAEPGRTVVEGTRYVLHTNTEIRTGGTFRPVGGFHTENFYVPDVPRFISFFCQKAPLLGGETGFVDLCRLYEGLPPLLKEKLEAQAFFVCSFHLPQVRERYGVSEDLLRELCGRAGLPIVEEGGQAYALMHKPAVFRHPVTGEQGLVINFAGELNGRGLRAALKKSFAADYKGWPWLVHRVFWRFPRIAALFDWMVVERAPLRAFVKEAARILRLATPPVFHSVQRSPRVGDAFGAEDVRQVAELMRRSFFAFQWRAGDFIVVDNLKLAHAGMPGLGSRELKAMITNPIVLNFDAQAPGLFEVPQAVSPVPLGQRLQQAAQAV